MTPGHRGQDSDEQELGTVTGSISGKDLTVTLPVGV